MIQIVLKSSLELYSAASAAKRGVCSFANLTNTKHEQKQSRCKEYPQVVYSSIRISYIISLQCTHAASNKQASPLNARVRI